MIKKIGRYSLLVSCFILLLLPDFLGRSSAVAGTSEPFRSEHRTLRLVVLPFGVPEVLKAESRDIVRELVRSHANDAELVELSAGVMGEGLESCLLSSACIDRVMRARRADGLLVGWIQSSESSNQGSSTRFLMALIAPAWPIAYVEKTCSLNGPSVAKTTRELLTIARPNVLPALMVSSAPSGEGTHTSGAKDDNEGDVGRREPEDDGEPGEEEEGIKSQRKKKAVEEETEKDLDVQLDEDEAGIDDDKRGRRERRKVQKSEKRTERRQQRAQREPRHSWTVLTEKQEHHWKTELSVDGGYGALASTAASQIEVDESGAVTGSYYWTVHDQATGFRSAIAVTRQMIPKLELGIALGAAYGPTLLVINTFRPDDPTYEFSVQDRGLHVLSTVVARYAFFERGGTRMTLGLGGGAWVMPKMEVTIEEAGPHAPLGPFVRLALEPMVGIHYLLTKRIYLGAEASALVDPLGAVVKESAKTERGGIYIEALKEIPAGASIVWSSGLNVGIVW